MSDDNNSNTNLSFLTDIGPDINRNFFKNQHSNEYDIDTLKSLITTNIFSLLYVSNSSQSKNSDNLSLFYKLLNKDHSGLGIFETWLSTISPINMLNIPNCSLIHSPCKSKRGGGGGDGGLGIYIHNVYTFIERPDLGIFY